MKRIDKLLMRAAEITQSILIALFPPDDDCFVWALGVALEEYARQNRDGTVGYDIMAALNDTALEVWGSVDLTQEEPEEPTKNKELPEKQEQEIRNQLLGMWRGV